MDFNIAQGNSESKKIAMKVLECRRQIIYQTAQLRYGHMEKKLKIDQLAAAACKLFIIFIIEQDKEWATIVRLFLSGKEKIG